MQTVQLNNVELKKYLNIVFAMGLAFQDTPILSSHFGNNAKQCKTL